MGIVIVDIAMEDIVILSEPKDPRILAQDDKLCCVQRATREQQH
jgi:hypothetical protein